MQDRVAARGQIDQRAVERRAVGHNQAAGAGLDCRVLHLEPEGETSELFWATVGGMGLTGIILRARIKMTKTETAYFISDTVADYVIEAVRLVAAGQSILSPSVTAQVLESVRTASAMPWTEPSRSTMGPPELPGLMAASVWMRPSTKAAP